MILFIQRLLPLLACSGALCLSVDALSAEAPPAQEIAAEQRLKQEDRQWEIAIKQALKLHEPQTDEPNARPELLQGIDDPAQRQEIYAEVIEWFSSDQPDNQVLYRGLGRGEAIQVAEQVLNYGGTESLPVLIKSREHPNAQLRWLAMDLLTHHGRAALDVLHDRIRNDPSGDVRSTAISVVREIQAPQSAAVLIEALQDPDLNVVIRAAHALGDYQDPAALDPLAQLLQTDMRHGRYSVCSAMMQIDAQRARPIVIPFAEKIRPRDRNEANNFAVLLRRARSPHSFRRPAIGIPQELEPIRALAKGALTLAGETYNHDQIDTLIAHINSEHYEIAAGCIKALVHLRARRAIPHLIEAIGQGPNHAHARSVQFRALTTFGGQEVIRALVGMYRDGCKPGAKRILSAHTVAYRLTDLGPAAVPLLMKMLDNPDLVTPMRLPVGNKTYNVYSHTSLSMLGDVMERNEVINLT